MVEVGVEVFDSQNLVRWGKQINLDEVKNHKNNSLNSRLFILKTENKKGVSPFKTPVSRLVCGGFKGAARPLFILSMK